MRDHKYCSGIALIASLLIANTITAQTNTFPASGNVGIGTTSPGVLLDISGSGARFRSISGTDQMNFGQWDGVYHRIEGDGNRDLLITSYSSKLRLGMSGATNLCVNSNGYIGIGTTSPGRMLDVNGDANIATNIVVGSSIYTNTYTANSSAAVNFKNASGTDIITYLSGGNVGIGTTNPQAKLHIAQDATRFIKAIPNEGIFSESGDDQNNPFVISKKGYGELILKTGLSSSHNERMRITSDGNVGVGTITPSEKLSVNGNIKAKKLIVTQTGWPDYVFHPAYKLKPISELEQFIQKNKRLPEMPSAKEVEEKGISVGDNQALLLKKIEELTLYILQQQKQITELKDRNQEFSLAIQQIQKKINQ